MQFWLWVIVFMYCKGHCVGIYGCWRRLVEHLIAQVRMWTEAFGVVWSVCRHCMDRNLTPNWGTEDFSRIAILCSCLQLPVLALLLYPCFSCISFEPSDCFCPCCSLGRAATSLPLHSVTALTSFPHTAQPCSCPTPHSLLNSWIVICISKGLHMSSGDNLTAKPDQTLGSMVLGLCSKLFEFQALTDPSFQPCSSSSPVWVASPPQP